MTKKKRKKKKYIFLTQLIKSMIHIFPLIKGEMHFKRRGEISLNQNFEPELIKKQVILHELND